MLHALSSDIFRRLLANAALKFLLSMWVVLRPEVKLEAQALVILCHLIDGIRGRYLTIVFEANLAPAPAVNFS